MSLSNENIHERAGQFAGTQWAHLSSRAQAGGAAGLDAMWEYRSTIYGHLFTAAGVSLIYDRLAQAAEHYRKGEHEAAADLFYDALCDAQIITDPFNE